MLREALDSTPPGSGLYLREKADKPGGFSKTVARDSEHREEEKSRALLCRQCGLVITRDDQRISRNEKHLHTFFNPAGIVYEIGCFRNASGCIAHGNASDEFSWFSGYVWQIVICMSCFEHLGWYFSGGDDSFFGLIINRLREG